jgi:hypothetical protein
MNDYLDQVKRILVIAFFVLSAAVIAYDRLWLEPGRVCEAAHNWWDPKTRICGRTIWIPDLTHRPAPSNAQKPWEQDPQKVR